MPISWGVIDPSMPGKVANSFYEGQKNALADAQALRANKLADLQYQNAQQEQTDRNALRGLNAAAPDYTQQVMRINPKLGMELSKMQTEQRTAKLAQAKTTLELMGNAATSVMANPTTEYAKAALSKFGQDTGVDVSGELAQIDAMQGNPDAIKRWAAGHAVKAADLLPKFQHFDQEAAVVTGSVDPITGRFIQGQAYQKAASPNAMLSAETARRGQNMVDARSREQLDQGKIPAGYRRLPDGTMQAIPGGPADLKIQGQFNQDTAALTSSTSAMDRLATAANEAMNHPGLAGTSGLRGAITNIPGTQAADAAALLNTLKSQAAFGVLQDMRNNSKTGGALGNVSDAEGKRLEANLAALEKSQSVEQLKANLKKIIDYTQGAKDRLAQAYNMRYKTAEGTGARRNQAPSAPAGAITHPDFPGFSIQK